MGFGLLLLTLTLLAKKRPSQDSTPSRTEIPSTTIPSMTQDPFTTIPSMTEIISTTIPSMTEISSKTIPSTTRIPPLVKFPLDPTFQEKMFQGKWYAIGLAQNTLRSRDLSPTDMHVTNFKLNDDRSYNATYTWLRGQECYNTSYPMVLSDQPSIFVPPSLPGSDNYTVRVLETDYCQSAILLYIYILKEKVYFDNILYARTVDLSPEMKRQFIEVSKSLGFSDDNISTISPATRRSVTRRRGAISDCFNSYGARANTRRSFLQYCQQKPEVQKSPL